MHCERSKGQTNGQEATANSVDARVLVPFLFEHQLKCFQKLLRSIEDANLSVWASTPRRIRPHIFFCFEPFVYFFLMRIDFEFLSSWFNRISVGKEATFFTGNHMELPTLCTSAEFDKICGMEVHVAARTSAVHNSARIIDRSGVKTLLDGKSNIFCQLWARKKMHLLIRNACCS